MTEYDSPTRGPTESPVLVLIGAAAGGAAGYALFWYARQWGFYAIVLPGALLGIGAGLARNRSVAMALICGLLALALGLFTEWRHSPFIRDGRIEYFFTHIHELKPITLGLIGLGGFIGFWMPFRRISTGG
jgi:multisubunit Na+/H+ antiporter MnhB subunit